MKCLEGNPTEQNFAPKKNNKEIKGRPLFSLHTEAQEIK